MIFLRSQFCALCISPSDINNYLSSGNLKLKKESYEKVKDLFKEQGKNL